MSDENKFDFSEEEIQKEAAVEQSKKAIQQDAKGLWQSIKTFMVELLDFREDTDRDATILAIKGDIPFKGATAWILVCSNSSCYRSYVNFSINGANFRCWFISCY